MYVYPGNVQETDVVIDNTACDVECLTSAALGRCNYIGYCIKVRRSHHLKLPTVCGIHCDP